MTYAFGEVWATGRSDAKHLMNSDLVLWYIFPWEVRDLVEGMGGGGVDIFMKENILVNFSTYLSRYHFNNMSSFFF